MDTARIIGEVTAPSGRAESALPQTDRPMLRRLLNFSQIREIGIRFSREHLWRLEAANKFPRRIYLSPQKIAWFEDEILAWLADRADQRANRVYRVHD
jgi:prophage regulatory protein